MEIYLKSNLKIYLCQLNFHVGNLNKNLEKIITAREEVKSNGGDLCIFSELSLTGYPPEDLVLRKSFIASVENVIKKLIPLSKDGGPALIVGYPRNDNGKLKNSAALIDNGDISIVDKYHLPNYGVFDEARVFDSERVSGPISFKGIRLGLMICEDMWFSDVAESLQESGAQILIVINGSPFDQNKEDERISVAVSRVIETKLPSNSPSKKTMSTIVDLLNSNDLEHYHEFPELPYVGINYATNEDEGDWDEKITPTIENQPEQ